MKFKIESRLNDGKAEAPAMSVTITDIEELTDAVCDALYSDEGVFVPVGTTITVERLA